MKLNRIGIILIACALAAITLVVTLLVVRQQDSQAAQVRVKGVGLAKSLSGIPVAQLDDGRTTGLLNALLAYHDDGNFAYAAITGADGRTLAEVASRGTMTPHAPLPADAAAGFAEREVPASPAGPALREFYGPMADRSNGIAFVRVGFHQPRFAVLARDVSFLALLALMMFLVVPVIYLLIKREMAPLAGLHDQLRQLAAPEQPAVKADDVRELVTDMQGYLAQAGERIARLELGERNSTADNRLLQYGSKKLNAALHSLPDGLLMLDPGGDVTFVSSKVEPLLGMSADALLGQPVDAWCRDPALRALLARYSGASRDGARPQSVEFASSSVDGRQLCATAQPLSGGQGAMSFGTLVVLRDVTREHLARQAGNDFVAHVSHELKSPLNVIGMYAEMLADSDEESLRVESLNVIQDEIERMNALVGNLLNVSKLDAGSLAPERHRVRLDDLLRDAYDQSMPRAQGKGLHVSLDMPRELDAVTIDKDLFRIALNNLLTNAIKYNRPGGSVALAARNDGHEIVISVRDTGIGIAAPDRDRIFEKFYRVSESGAPAARGGHGLGLYLAAQIVELHHGRIAVDSEPGIGSTFSIHLKSAPAPIGAPVL
ncbi:ATP-binding protein [Pseudoduganella sp. SL102]|uniref:PAS domain-containing sensor histidine kinase n=1 Tax=Pseudoduganella sp. SL102 TaxID=2995154 RepID=UPI00248D2108|nr:ATP-binding protein [Pseudoduganella sp. SL102]WBS01060.1 ATP-binding protein [Pseudoduganella sp. SL102]